MRRSKKNSSKNLFFTVAIVVAVAAAAVTFVIKGEYLDRSPSAYKKKSDDVVVAEINGKPIYSSEAEKQFSNMVQGAQGASFSQLDEKAKFVVIRELAAQKMILEDAYKNGINTKSTVKERVDAFAQNVIKEEFLQQMAKDQVTDEKIQERYNKDAASLEGKSQFRIKHILVKNESEIKKVQKLLKTSSFEKVAKDKSIDEKTSLTGGDLGFLIEGNMVPEIEQALVGVEVGGISKPVKTSFGWHIIKLESKKPAEAAPFDQVKNILARALYEEAIHNYIKSTIEKAEIEIVAMASSESAKSDMEEAIEADSAEALEDGADENAAPDAEKSEEPAENNG